MKGETGMNIAIKNSILIGDALEMLRMLEDNSVDCCVTSPPYYGLRDYGVNGQIGLEETPEAYIERLVTVFREVRRVLKDDGTLWVNIGDSYAVRSGGAPTGYKPKDLIGIPWMLAFVLRADGWYLRSDIIWHKPNCMPESVKDRPTKCYEHIFLLAKSQRYYYDNDAVLVPAHYDGRRETLNKGSSKYAETVVPGNRPQSQHITGEPHERWRFKDGKPIKNRRDIWSVSTRPFKGAHFATFPEKLIEPCILAGCRPGGIVLDPFFGSGTTGKVAMDNGRAFIGIDINPEYAKIAIQRIYPAEVFS